MICPLPCLVPYFLLYFPILLLYFLFPFSLHPAFPPYFLLSSITSSLRVSFSASSYSFYPTSLSSSFTSPFLFDLSFSSSTAFNPSPPFFMLLLSFLFSYCLLTFSSSNSSFAALLLPMFPLIISFPPYPPYFLHSCIFLLFYLLRSILSIYFPFPLCILQLTSLRLLFLLLHSSSTTSFPPLILYVLPFEDGPVTELQINRPSLSHCHPSRWRRKGRNTEEKEDTGGQEGWRSQQGLRSKLMYSEFRGQPGALPTCGEATRSQRSADKILGKGHRRPASRTSRRSSDSPASQFDDITALSSSHRVLVTHTCISPHTLSFPTMNFLLQSVRLFAVPSHLSVINS